MCQPVTMTGEAESERLSGESLYLQIGDSVAANLLASRRGLFRSLEGAERQLVRLIDDLCVRSGRCLQAGPWEVCCVSRSVWK